MRVNSSYIAGRILVPAISILVLVGLLIAIWIPSYADYEPHVRISEIFNFAQSTELAIESHCTDSVISGNDENLTRAIKAVSIPATVKDVIEEIKLTKKDRMRLELTISVNDIYWGALWRAWQVAIPSGSTVTFEYICSEENSTEFHFLASTIQREFLPHRYQDRLR